MKRKKHLNKKDMKLQLKQLDITEEKEKNNYIGNICNLLF